MGAEEEEGHGEAIEKGACCPVAPAPGSPGNGKGSAGAGRLPARVCVRGKLLNKKNQNHAAAAPPAPSL